MVDTTQSDGPQRESLSSQNPVLYIWRSPLLQAIGTLRAAGQIYCANELEQLWTVLHQYDPTERSELKIVQGILKEQEERGPAFQLWTNEDLIQAYEEMKAKGMIEEVVTPFGTMRVLKHSLLVKDAGGPDTTKTKTGTAPGPTPQEGPQL